jgi:hypothetical protein
MGDRGCPIRGNTPLNEANKLQAKNLSKDKKIVFPREMIVYLQ